MAVLPVDTDGELLSDTLTRIGCLLGIYRSLHTIFPSQQQADRWIHRPNSAALFKGDPAIVLICSGRLEDLLLLRDYLNGQGVDDS